MSEKIISLIQESVNYLNKMLTNKVPVEKGEDCALFGDSGVLDSMSLVTLIVDLEERLEKAFNKPFILASEKAMSQKRSPFLTVGTLHEYIESILLERKDAA